MNDSATACIPEIPSQTKEPVPIERVRVSLTQDSLAALMASAARGCEVNHPAAKHFQNGLYDSIHGMVYELCKHYSTFCGDDPEDLLHDCLLNISKKIGHYNSKISRLTTWSWHVSRNLLASKTRRAGLRLRKTVELPDNISEDAVAGGTVKKTPKALVFEIRDAAIDLARKNPEQKEIVFAMLGNPADKDYTMPDKIDIGHVAKTCNVSYQETYLFLRKIVRPYMMKKFK